MNILKTDENIKKAIDYILKNIDKIYNSFENINEERNEITFRKHKFDELIYLLIYRNKEYFFKKINEDKNNFKKYTQDIFIGAIVKSLYELKETEIENSNEIEKDTEWKAIRLEKNEEFVKSFLIELNENIGINNLKSGQITNTGTGRGSYVEINEKENYYNLILEYFPDFFKEIDINLLTSKNTSIPKYLFKNEYFSKIIKKKFLEIKTINYGDIINNNGNLTKNKYGEENLDIFISDEIINHVIKNFSQKEVLNYLIFLNSRVDVYQVFINESDKIDRIIFNKKNISKIPFTGKLFNIKKKLQVKSQKYIRNSYSKKAEILNSDFIQNILNPEDKLTKILKDTDLLKIIALFPENFNNFKDVLNSKPIDLISKLSSTSQQNIIHFIEITKKTDNIKINLKLEDINENFINFMSKKFPKELGGDLFYKDIDKLNDFFDIEIASLDFFKKGLSIQNSILSEKRNSSFNLDKICDLFDLDKKLSTFVKIEKDFNSFLGNNEHDFIYLNTFLSKGYLENLDNIILYFKKIHKKELNLNEVLLVLKEIRETKIHFTLIETLDKNIDNFDAKELIQIDGNNISSNFEKTNKINEQLYHINFDWELINSLKIFKFNNFEQVIVFLDSVSNNKIFCDDLRSPINYDLEYTIGNPLGYFEKDYRNYKPVIAYMLNKYLIQKAIDSGDYSKLENYVEVLLRTFEYITIEKFDIKEFIKKMEDVLKLTDGFLSESLIKVFISGVKHPHTDTPLSINIEESIEKVKDYTGIELISEDLKNDLVVSFIKHIQNGLFSKDKNNIINFFNKYPTHEDKGRFWKVEDIIGGGFLNKILFDLNFSFRLIEEKGLNLKELSEFFSYDLVVISNEEINNIIKYDNIYYGYFKESINKERNIYGKILGDFPINFENFTDYMSDNEILLTFKKDKGFKTNGIQPWTKAWFIEAPGRIEYIKDRNKLNIFRDYGTILGLYKNGEKIEAKDNLMTEFSNILGFNINIEMYLYIREAFIYYRDKDIDLKEITFKFIGLNKNNFKLLIGYLQEHGISLYYFVKDILLLKSSVNIKTMNNLLKNKIYPTNNILDFLKNGGKVEQLVKSRINYKENGGFDTENKLNIDLEYINFRYMIDNSSGKNEQVGKGYNEYLQLISKNYDEDIDEKKEYKQAGYESFVAKSFIDKVKAENHNINVFTNLSYGKVISSAINNELGDDDNINFKTVRIGSTECHGRKVYLKKSLFSKEDIKKIFLGDSIILDGTTNNSFPDSNIGFKSYIYVLNKALSDILSDDSFIKEYEEFFIENIELDKNYLEILKYVKGIILRNGLEKNTKFFKFIYVSQNEGMYLNTRSHNKSDLLKYDNSKSTEDKLIKYIYYGDFVERDGKYSKRQAYFDDKHITKFKLIGTDKGFSYVDTKFEDKLRKHYLDFEEEGKKDFIFNYYEE